SPSTPTKPSRRGGVCEAMGLQLRCGREPLDRPRHRFLAERALVRATDGAGLDVDLSLVMAGLDFETVWAERRVFRRDSRHPRGPSRAHHRVETSRGTREGPDVPGNARRGDPGAHRERRAVRVEAPAQLAPTKAEGQSSTPSTVIRRGRTSGRRRPPPIVRTTGRTAPIGPRRARRSRARYRERRAERLTMVARRTIAAQIEPGLRHAQKRRDVALLVQIESRQAATPTVR